MLERLVEFLKEQLLQRNLEGVVHDRLIRQEGKWFYVPVHIAIRDAYAKAQVLQEMEDKWSEQNPDISVLLVPAAN